MTNTDKRPISWVKLIATLIAIAGVGFVLFLKNKRHPDPTKKEATKTEVASPAR